MDNPTIQVAGRVLEAAVCPIRGCRVYPPSELAAHKEAHRRFEAETIGHYSWRETAHRKGVRGNRHAGRPKGVSAKTKRVCDLVTAYVAQYPDGCTSRQILGVVGKYYGTHQIGVAALARLFKGGLIDNVMAIKEGRRYHVYPEAK